MIHFAWPVVAAERVQTRLMESVSRADQHVLPPQSLSGRAGQLPAGHRYPNTTRPTEHPTGNCLPDWQLIKINGTPGLSACGSDGRAWLWTPRLRRRDVFAHRGSCKAALFSGCARRRKTERALQRIPGLGRPRGSRRFARQNPQWWINLGSTNS